MASKLYVGGLSYDTSEDTLRDTFAKAGKVASVSIIIDRMTNNSKGFGFVEMESDADAQSAISMFDGFELEGRKLTVNEARPKTDRPAGGGGGNWNDRGGNGGGRSDSRRRY